MGTTTKTVFKNYDYSRCDDFAAYLSRMAAKGWHFREWGFGLEFDRGEPQQVEYAVEVFTKASESAVLPQPKTREFGDYCKAAGWEFVDSQRKFCIFRKIDEQAVRIFTPEERITNVFRSIVTVSDVIGAVFLALFILFSWYRIIDLSVLNLFNEEKIWMLSTWSLLCLEYLCGFVSAFWLRAKLKKELRKEQEIYVGYQKNRRYFFRVQHLFRLLLLAAVVYFFVTLCSLKMAVIIGVTLALILVFSYWLHKYRPELKENVVAKVFFVVFLMILLSRMGRTTVKMTDEYVSEQLKKFPILPVEYGVNYGKIKAPVATNEKTIFGSKDSYSYYYEVGQHWYSNFYMVYRTPLEKLLDHVWEDELSVEENNKNGRDCTEDWGAVRAIRGEDGIYYVRYENALFLFSDKTDVELTAESIALFRDRFDLR